MARGVHRSAATRNWCAMTGHASSIPVPRAPALLRPICILATFANEVALCDTSQRILYTCTCASSLILRGQPTGCKVSHSPLSYVWYIHADAADDRHAHTVRERERERERESHVCTCACGHARCAAHFYDNCSSGRLPRTWPLGYAYGFTNLKALQITFQTVLFLDSCVPSTRYTNIQTKAHALEQFSVRCSA